MITGGMKIDAGGRGIIYQWRHSDAGFSAFWPNVYAQVAPEVDRAANAVLAGIAAVSEATDRARESFKKSNDIYEVTREAILRSVASPFRGLRESTIDLGNAVTNSRRSIDAPISPETTVPVNPADPTAAEIRTHVAGFERPAEAFEWILAQPGISTLNAIVPYIGMTAFNKMPELAGLLRDEFAFRQKERATSTPASDSYSDAANPTRKRPTPDALRDIVKAQLENSKLRETAVTDAEKFLKSVIGFTQQAGRFEALDDAFNYLMGRPAR